MFTYRYSQPNEYHFSLDSIEAPLSISNWNAKNGIEAARVLDLCAGCGVMGFEYFYRNRRLQEIQFLEIQKDYLPHFNHNKKLVIEDFLRTKQFAQISTPTFDFQNLNYKEIAQRTDWSGYFDLILCNPPYFRPGQGKASPSEFKNRCRFYIDASFLQLLEAILISLHIKGSAFLLLRPLDNHGYDVHQELSQFIAGRASYESIGNIRGTDLIRIFKTR